MVSVTRPKYLKSRAGVLNFLLVIKSHDFKVCQKNRLHPILMKLGIMLEVDETFTTKDKTNLDLLEQETVSDSGISWPYADLHLTPDR